MEYSWANNAQTRVGRRIYSEKYNANRSNSINECTMKMYKSKKILDLPIPEEDIIMFISRSRYFRFEITENIAMQNIETIKLLTQKGENRDKCQ